MCRPKRHEVLQTHNARANGSRFAWRRLSALLPNNGDAGTGRSAAIGESAVVSIAGAHRSVGLAT
jgi:hypothetical protein